MVDINVSSRIAEVLSMRTAYILTEDKLNLCDGFKGPYTLVKAIRQLNENKESGYVIVKRQNEWVDKFIYTDDTGKLVVCYVGVDETGEMSLKTAPLTITVSLLCDGDYYFEDRSKLIKRLSTQIEL